MRAFAFSAAGGCAVVLAACGSSAHGYHNPKYPYGAPNVPISMSRCLRANGVPNFPDPREGPNGGGVGWPGGLGVSIGGTGLMVFGQVFKGPAFVHAETVCKEYMPPSGPPPAVPEGQKIRALDDAACMRKHGLSNFPDPQFGGGAPQLVLPPGLSPSSPAVKRAAQACGVEDSLFAG